MKRIICVGNRYVEEDSAGPRVYDALSRKKGLPPGVEIIDGGLAGLNLLPFFETSEKMILVDSVTGFGQSDDVMILKPSDVMAAAQNNYDHSAGVGFLLRILPDVCEGTLPEIAIVGIAGYPDPNKIQKAAELALKMVI